MARIARMVWVFAFLVGAFTHGREILAGGWLPYDIAPIGLNWFWSLLLPLDVTATALVILRRREGTLLGLAIIIADVAVNSWFAAQTGWLDLYAALQWQSLFCGFALGTAHLLWQDTVRRTA